VINVLLIVEKESIVHDGAKTLWTYRERQWHHILAALSKRDHSTW